MKKYFVGIAALAITAVSVGATLQAKAKATFATTFQFIGTTNADYYVAAGWKIYNSTTDPVCPGGSEPCRVSHASITTPAALATSLSSAGQGSIQADMTLRNVSILAEKDL